MYIRAIFLSALIWLAVTPCNAEAPPVVVSIKPIHALTAALMAGAGQPDLLITGAASPHQFTLRPSDARKLAQARLVILIGPTLEGFLERPLKSLAAGAQRLDLSDLPGLIHRRAETRHDHDHDHGETRDMHLWLDPVNALVMARAIATTLSTVDPANASLYATNGEKLAARLRALDSELAGVVHPLAGRPYVVFHDAYRHFEDRYGLKRSAAIAVNPERPPGARHLREIRRRITADKIRCVFSEPQFPPRLGRTVTDGTTARTAILDPLGAGLAPGPDAYFQLMRELAANFAGCLS